MLIQMAGDFLFWWLLVLGVGIGVVMVLDKYVRHSRKRHATSDGPFSWLHGRIEKSSHEPVEEPPTAATASAAAPIQAVPLFQAPMAEPRRYFIGKGPADEERS
ncbi:MAG TPA: hypothetical protein VFB33_00375 [Candidatus Binataceae bacterium]|jgi:hypothetical protein|nr:hypothetical protein [Candidatus Binataceae bacterium]